MTFKEIQKLIKFAKKQGLSELNIDGLMFKFAESPEKQGSLQNSTVTELPPEDSQAIMPSDSDLLFWSTDAFDQITESRKKPAHE